MPQTAKPSPVCPGRSGRFPTPSGLKRLQRGHRILVVDSDDTTRANYELTLRAVGHHVVAVETVDEGLARLAREPYDLVLGAVQPPGRDGLWLTRELRQRDATRDLPIVLMSDGERPHDPVRALNAGADDVVTEPAHPQELVARVNASISRAIRHRDLKRRSTHDPLTGLMSRNAILDEIMRELKRTSRTNSPVSVMMVDLDGFKAINDMHGHLVGDEALRRVALKLEADVRATDRVGRFGGDEFIVVLPDTDEAQLDVMLERLKRGWRRHPPLVPLAARPIMASFGGATSAPGRSMEALVHAADAQMYRDKRHPIR